VGLLERDARRYLVLVRNDDNYTPEERGRLIILTRGEAGAGVSVNDVRIASRHVEFDLFAEPSAFEKLRRYLDDRYGVLETKELSKDEEMPDWDKVLKKAVELFNQERYWETHEVLEGAWKNASGREKDLLHAVILVAAALVHTQKNESDRAKPMLERALRSMRSWRHDAYRGLDVRSLREGVEEIVASGRVKRFKLAAKFKS